MKKCKKREKNIQALSAAASAQMSNLLMAGMLKSYQLYFVLQPYINQYFEFPGVGRLAAPCLRLSPFANLPRSFSSLRQTLHTAAFYCPPHRSQITLLCLLYLPKCKQVELGDKLPHRSHCLTLPNVSMLWSTNIDID